jgi:signal transduction histidine kinase
MFLILCGIVIVAGLALLIYNILVLNQERAVNTRKLEELQKENESMEELMKKTQELEHVQRLEMIGTMTSGIAHEFNNLLTPIMGYSIMTLEKIPEEDTELSENIIEIYNASRKAKDVIRRLSELSRKNPSYMTVKLSPDDILKKVRDTSLPAKPKNVEVVLETGCGNWQFAGNETQITQLLLNLVINAFHAMEKDGGTLCLSTRAVNVTNEIIFQVTDTGTGIPEEILPHIFDPFYTTKEAGKGTGLGLAIAKNVVEQYHGSINVKSEPGKGSTFTVRLPGIRPETTVHISEETPAEGIGSRETKNDL